MAYFSLLVIVIFNFALELREVTMDAIAPGMLWVAVSFAGVLGLNRTFVREQERGAIEGMLLSPVDRGSIYIGKFLGNLFFMLIVEVFTVPAFAIMFNLRTLGPGLIPALGLGTIGFAAVGTLFAAISVNTRAREVMLPVLLFPILVPVIIASVKSVGFAMLPDSFQLAIPWLNLMIAFDAIFLVVSYLVFEYALVD